MCSDLAMLCSKPGCCGAKKIAESAARGGFDPKFIPLHHFHSLSTIAMEVAKQTQAESPAEVPAKTKTVKIVKKKRRPARVQIDQEALKDASTPAQTGLIYNICKSLAAVASMPDTD